MIVNVCPAATTKASPDSVWNVIKEIGRWGDWTDAVVGSVEPPGAMQPGQVVRLHAPWLRFLRFTIDIGDIDPQHLTLTETKAGGTLVRFN
ncbi:MAG TPA: hypothetical protein VKE27_10625 [Candidatus Dormibacteraeota bacterium]|nr:hypothetical protein [Candidatus Dormibacteraeota bacterium]